MKSLKTVVLGMSAAIAIILGTALPSTAQSAVLTATDPNSRILVRSRPTTNSYSPGYGLPGDRVNILQSDRGPEGYTWYFVEFVQSGEQGWIRGDFVSTTSNSGSGGGGDRPGDYYYQQGYERGQQAIRAGQAYNPTPIAGIPSQQQEAYRTGYGDGYLSVTGSTVINFETVDYAVRLYRPTGQLLMNVYDKKARVPVLIGSPATEVTSSGRDTTYVNTGSGTQYFVTQAGRNDYVLTIVENGRTIYREASD